MSDHQATYLKLLLAQETDLRAFVGSIIRDPHLREDVFQDVAVILWKKFAQYDPARPFGAWARGIAANRIKQALTARKRQPVCLEAETIDWLAQAEPVPDDAARAAEEAEALRQCLERLPPRARRLLALRYDQGLKLRELAEQVGKKLDAVHKALSRIRAGLRLCIERKLAAWS